MNLAISFSKEMRSVSAASCAVVLSCLAVGSCSFVPDFLAWANPWDGLKKYLFQDEVSPLDTTPGNSSSVLHHDVAPWTKGRTDGLPGKLSPGFAVSGLGNLGELPENLRNHGSVLSGLFLTPLQGQVRGEDPCSRQRHTHDAVPLPLHIPET